MLFRPYDIKYNKDTSAMLKKYPIESERLNDIVKFITINTDSNTIICLQECSEELMTRLEEAFGSTYDIFYQRTNNRSNRNDELIITMAPKTGYFYTISLHRFRGSRGYLGIANEDCRIINCHFRPMKFCRDDPIKAIESIPYDKTNILVGDFNESYSKLSNKITRFQMTSVGHTYKRKQIDHIIHDYHSTISGKRISTNSMSDHYAIIATGFVL